jgi:hypothetical protein
MRHLASGHPILLSEFGACGAQDYLRCMRHFEQWGEEQSADARLHKMQLNQFMENWRTLRMDECWARPEDYFAESHRYQAALMQRNYNAWLGNPGIIGTFSSNHVSDGWYHGGGQATYFRELKPGMAEACADMLMPARLSLFVDRTNVYSGERVRLEAVLFNADAIAPGRYPLLVTVVDPEGERKLEKTVMVDIPANALNSEPPFTQVVFDDELEIAGSRGKHRFLASFERGAVTGGGETTFFVDRRLDMPDVDVEVIVWGGDPELLSWLRGAGFNAEGELPVEGNRRELILVSSTPAGAGERDLAELERRIARGANVVFLTPHLVGGQARTEAGSLFDARRLELRWPIFESGATLFTVRNFWFRMDQWAKEHPIFEGMPAGGLMDQVFYQDILPDQLLMSEGAAECVSGAIQTSTVQWTENEASGAPLRGAGTMITCHRHGAGSFIVNTLRIREQLGASPAAERLLRNMLNYASQDLDKPLV